MTVPVRRSIGGRPAGRVALVFLLVGLVGLGGLFYTLGAVVYGIKRPNPSPRWFGFHEVFHTLTILAFVSHYVAASLALSAVSA